MLQNLDTFLISLVSTFISMSPIFELIENLL